MATTNKIRVENQTLIQDAFKTYLTSDTASASGTLSVKNLTGITGAQIVVIGEIGNEGTEMIKSSSATSLTITLASNTAYPHSSGTPVYIINYDQIKFYTATTLTGSKSLLSTENVQVDSEFTIYEDSSGSTGYYFTLFYNSITAASSGYSDGSPVAGYSILTARSIIDNALGMINKTPSEVLSDDFSFQQINNCQMEVLRELKRWAFMQKFNESLGELTEGQWKVSIPTDLDDEYTNKSIYNFRIGTQENLFWVDKAKWNEITEGVANTTLSTAITASSTTTVFLTNSSNFTDSGVIAVGENTYTFTSNDRTNNILVLDSLPSTSDSSGTDVFQGATLGRPIYWTIFGGYLYYYPVLGSTYNQNDGLLDYYIKPISIDDDSDEIVLPDPTIAQYYLAWKMLIRIQSGKDDSTSQAMFNQYILRREKLKQKEVLGRTFKLKPIVNSIDMTNNTDNREQRTGAFDTGW